jgi:catalase
VPRPVEGVKTRDRAADDVYAQATLFWNSMTETEQDHIVDAYTFELGKVEVPGVVDRMVSRLALIDGGLAQRVCFGLGLPGPMPPDMVGAPGQDPDDDRSRNADDPDAVAIDATGGVESSPALAMITADAYPIDGRVVHILANDGCDLTGIRALQTALLKAGAVPHVVATHKGAIRGRGKDELVVDRSFHTASSAEADAIVVAHGTGLANELPVMTYVQSAFRHFKPVAAWGDGNEVLDRAGIDSSAPGVLVADKSNRAFAADLVAALGAHRHWDRAGIHPTRTKLEEAV